MMEIRALLVGRDLVILPPRGRGIALGQGNLRQSHANLVDLIRRAIFLNSIREQLDRSIPIAALGQQFRQLDARLDGKRRIRPRRNHRLILFLRDCLCWLRWHQAGRDFWGS